LNDTFFFSAPQLKRDSLDSGDLPMKKPLEPGTRVRIAANHHWAQSALGTVREPPGQILARGGGWQGNVREVQGVKGKLCFQWVEFDEPHRDSDGDGPYGAGEIQVEFLEAAV